MIKVGMVVELKLVEERIDNFAGWFIEMVEAKETGVLVEVSTRNYRVRPLSKDTACPHKDFGTARDTFKVLKTIQRF